MKFLLFCAILISIHYAPGEMYRMNWFPDFMQNIRSMNDDIRKHVENMNEEIQENVQSNLNRIREHVQQAAQSSGSSSSSSFGQGSVFVNSGSSGTSNSVVSGFDSDGNPYTHFSEDKIIGNILHHTDRIHHPQNKTTKEVRYTLDLSDPNAQPVILSNNTSTT